MSVKILGGIAKGTIIDVPSEDGVRPTSVLLKKKPFDSFQQYNDSLFVDLCAGSGAVGLEALSRGARKVILVEKNKKFIGVIRKNSDRAIARFISAGELAPAVEFVNSDIISWLAHFKSDYLLSEERDNVTVFFDPPYQQHDLYKNVLEFFLLGGWFKGLFWVESDSKKGPSEIFWKGFSIEPDKVFSQGDSCIFCYNMG